MKLAIARTGTQGDEMKVTLAVGENCFENFACEALPFAVGVRIKLATARGLAADRKENFELRIEVFLEFI